MKNDFVFFEFARDPIVRTDQQFFTAFSRRKIGSVLPMELAKGGGAPPRIPPSEVSVMSEKYTERLHLKVRPSEKQRIETRAEMAGMGVSGYLRQAAFASTLHPREDHSDLIAALNAIGNNLNQISKHCNAHPSHPFTRSVAVSICHCEEMLERLLAHVKRRK